jgi:hypothetical protein
MRKTPDLSRFSHHLLALRARRSSQIVGFQAARNAKAANKQPQTARNAMPRLRRIPATVGKWNSSRRGFG